MEYSNKSYAIAYALKGLAVFPIKYKAKTPLTKNGFKDATTDVKQIQKWWNENPKANIGIATGKVSGNVFVIDLDKDDDKGVDGYHTLKDWERDNAELPVTINSITGRGGYHYFYKASKNVSVQSRIALMDGIDIRGEGGYIIAPPSIHPNGNAYEWETDFDDLGIAIANDTVMKFLSFREKEDKQSFKVERQIASGQRNGTLYSMACSLQAKGLDDDTILMCVKMENDKKCVPPLSDNEVEQLVGSALHKDKGEIHFTNKTMPVAKQFITLDVKTDKQGNEHVIQSIHNVETVLEMDEQLAGKLFFNTLSYSPFIKGELPWEHKQTFREWNNFDDSNLKCYLEKEYGLNVDKKVIDGLNNVVKRHEYNPVIDYLEQFTWDGKDHISTLLPKYLGVEDNEYSRECMKLFMLGAITRAYHPGAKFDYMPVLVGEQGVGKSTFFRILAGNDNWYNDNFNTIEGDKATEKLRGMWIVELAELLATKRAKEIESIKAFITSTVDSYRPPYARLTEQRPRVCVFAGTTNNMHFLTDRTGNRRYLPLVVCKKNVKKSMFTHKKEVMEDFQQAWAQAMHIYRTEHPELILPKHLQDYVKDQQKQFVEEDSRVGIIQEYLDNLSYDCGRVCCIQLWENALGMEQKPLDRRTSNEIHDIMTHCIDGWQRVRNSQGGRCRTAKFGIQICYERIKVRDTDFVEVDEEVPFD